MCFLQCEGSKNLIAMGEELEDVPLPQLFSQAQQIQINANASRLGNVRLFARLLNVTFILHEHLVLMSFSMHPVHSSDFCYFAM